MTDSDDIDDLQVTYRGQRYRRIAVEPYTRDDGSETRLATWESDCPVCGEPFTITTTRLHRLRSPNRRCAEHRRPGAPVGRRASNKFRAGVRE
jgi:hypothetical protein